MGGLLRLPPVSALIAKNKKANKKEFLNAKIYFQP